MTNPFAALIGLDMEDVARAIYDAMRFERRDKTPDWVKGGNSNAQVEARATAARILAALEAAPVPDLVEAGPPFFFDRYINGVRMAEDVCVERETTLEGAIHVAARIAAKGPNGEPPVLVYRHTETAALIALATAQAAQIAGLEKDRDEAREKARMNSFAGEGYVYMQQRAEAAEAKVAELEAQIAGMQNEKILSKATYDGVSSLLLSVQQDCIAEHQRAEAAETALAAERAKAERLRGRLQDMVAVAAQDGWDKAMTGRQLIIADARAALSEAEARDD